MNNINIINNILHLSDELLNSINADEAEEIKNKYHGKVMMKLHETEVKFFEWLKENDAPVWEDLWADDEDTKYLVSIDFLPFLVKYRKQFPICDLISLENYFFVPLHLKGKEVELLADTLKTRLRNKETLTPAQLLMIEISLNPIDIWHFSHKYKISITEAKKAVQQLVEDGSIVHFTEAGQLANFIDV